VVIGHRDWCYWKYQLNATQWVESWILYETYWCEEVKSFVVRKICEKDIKIIDLS